MNSDRIEQLIELFRRQKNDLDVFGSGIAKWFDGNSGLREKSSIHSIKYRLKDEDHLRRKLQRKFADVELSDDDFFNRITDLVGVRILHLHQAQFAEINNEIQSKVESGDWILAEDPVAFTWDPDSRKFFEDQGLVAKLRETHYTSVHYLVRPRADSRVCCEVQVRTLFEEIWGEVDHIFNYPDPTENIAVREQLRVLSKLVGAGSRLLDSIFRIA